MPRPSDSHRHRQSQPPRPWLPCSALPRTAPASAGRSCPTRTGPLPSKLFPPPARLAGARSALTLVLAIVLCLCSAPAAAEDEGGLPLRRLGFDRSADLLTISVRFPDIFDAAALAKLQSGFPSTIVLRAYLFRDQEQVPMGVVLRTTRIVFDLWDEVYLVRIVDERGEATFKATSQNAAVASATTLDRFPLIPRSRLASGQRFALVVLVELNPVSPELLAQVRKWLARPPGGQRMLGPGDSLLGSFVSFFVNQRLSEAERALRFRSQPFTAR